MARGLRIQFPGAWYHVAGRGNERRNLFRDDRDRLHFLELLEESVELFRLRICGYVLMDNHWHGLVQTPEANLSAACQWVGQSYATWFNRRHHRVGHLFQGRFAGILVDAETYGCEVSRYVHLNPVRTRKHGLDKQGQAVSRAGALARPPNREELAARLKQVREYRWSSYPYYIGDRKTPAWLDTGTVLGWLGASSVEDRPSTYRRFVEEAIREGLPESPWEWVKGGVLGDLSFIRKVSRWIKGNKRAQPALRRLEARASFEQVVGVVEKIRGESWAKFRDRHGDWGRDVVLELARRHAGLSLRELGEKAGGMDYAAVSASIQRLKGRALQDKKLAELIKHADRQVSRLRKGS